MADKEKLKSGIANLIGGADSSVSKQRLQNLAESFSKPTEQPVTDEATPEEQTEGAAEKAASQITAKFHSLISKSIWDE